MLFGFDRENVLLGCQGIRLAQLLPRQPHKHLRLVTWKDIFGTLSICLLEKAFSILDGKFNLGGGDTLFCSEEVLVWLIY